MERGERVGLCDFLMEETLTREEGEDDFIGVGGGGFFQTLLEERGGGTGGVGSGPVKREAGWGGGSLVGESEGERGGGLGAGKIPSEVLALPLPKSGSPPNTPTGLAGEPDLPLPRLETSPALPTAPLPPLPPTPRP